MLRSVFLRTVPPTEVVAAPFTHSLFVYRGPDWCLQELQNSAGETVRSWSYEIEQQSATETPVGEVLHLQVTQRGKDWVGSCLLETGEYPCRLCKEDEKGCVLQFGGWEQILWRDVGGWVEARAWALASAVLTDSRVREQGIARRFTEPASSAVAASASSAVAASVVRPPHAPHSHPIRSTHRHSADHRPADHRSGRRGDHRSHPSVAAPSAHGAATPGASVSASVCKIRLPGS